MMKLASLFICLRWIKRKHTRDVDGFKVSLSFVTLLLLYGVINDTVFTVTSLSLQVVIIAYISQMPEHDSQLKISL